MTVMYPQSTAEQACPLQELDVEWDVQHGAAWVYLQPQGRPCFSPALLGELRRVQHRLAAWAREGHGDGSRLRYQVVASRVPGVFSLGGDLELFMQLIEQRDEHGLDRYLQQCLEMVYATARGYGSDVTTIALVQGDALGGGFETALAADVIVAERGTYLGFPERLFNLFPGMGAHSLLLRRVEPVKAFKIIESGINYSAEQLYEMGVVDVLAPPSEGQAEVFNLMKTRERHGNAARYMQRVRRHLQPTDLQELVRVGRLWVECAMNLEPRDMRMMRRLAESQRRLVAGASARGEAAAPVISSA